MKIVCVNDEADKGCDGCRKQRAHEPVPAAEQTVDVLVLELTFAVSDDHDNRCHQEAYCIADEDEVSPVARETHHGDVMNEYEHAEGSQASLKLVIVRFAVLREHCSIGR